MGDDKGTMATQSPQFIAYWQGYATNGVTFAPMPSGTTIAIPFLVGLNPVTTLGTDFISSDGVSWNEILSWAHELQSEGIKVLAGVMSNKSLSWNTIPEPDKFARDLKSLVLDEWGLDGIEIDPEQAGGIAPNDTFIKTVQAIRAEFGSEGLLSYVSYVLSNDRALLTKCASALNHVDLMGYFWDLETMKAQYHAYATVVSPTPVYLGVSPVKTQSLDLAAKVAQFAAATSQGMMMFATSQDVVSITNKPDGTWAQTLLSALK